MSKHPTKVVLFELFLVSPESQIIEGLEEPLLHQPLEDLY